MALPTRTTESLPVWQKPSEINHTTLSGWKHNGFYILIPASILVEAVDGSIGVPQTQLSVAPPLVACRTRARLHCWSTPLFQMSGFSLPALLGHCGSCGENLHAAGSQWPRALLSLQGPPGGQGDAPRGNTTRRLLRQTNKKTSQTRWYCLNNTLYFILS